MKKVKNRRRVIVNGPDKIWSAALVDMQAFSKFNNGYKYLLTVIDVFSKYAWVIPIKDKKGSTVAKAFKTILSSRTPEKLWVDEGKEFYNAEFRKMLGTITSRPMSMYQTFNEGKTVIIERFNRTLKRIMWKYFTAKNTNKYIDVLQDMVKNIMKQNIVVLK